MPLDETQEIGGKPTNLMIRNIPRRYTEDAHDSLCPSDATTDESSVDRANNPQQWQNIQPSMLLDEPLPSMPLDETQEIGGKPTNLMIRNILR